MLRASARVLAHRGIAAGSFRLDGKTGPVFVRSHSNLMRRVYWFGTEGHEPELAALLPVLASRSHAILEVGANVGYHTVQMASSFTGDSFVAVEANPTAAAELRANLAANELQIDVAEVAATPEPAGTVSLAIPNTSRSDTPGNTRLADFSAFSTNMRKVTLVEVESRAVTDLVPEGMDLLKLDVEGMETVLLSALEEKIRRTRPIIVVEALDERNELREWLDRLIMTNYRVLLPSTSAIHGCVDITETQWTDRGTQAATRQRDVVMAPPESWLVAALDREAATS